MFIDHLHLDFFLSTLLFPLSLSPPLSLPLPLPLSFSHSPLPPLPPTVPLSLFLSLPLPPSLFPSLCLLPSSMTQAHGGVTISRSPFGVCLGVCECWCVCVGGGGGCACVGVGVSNIPSCALFTSIRIFLFHLPPLSPPLPLSPSLSPSSPPLLHDPGTGGVTIYKRVPVIQLEAVDEEVLCCLAPLTGSK